MEPLTTFILLAALSITLFIVLVVLWLRGQDVKQLRRENKILLKSNESLSTAHAEFVDETATLKGRVRELTTQNVLDREEIQNLRKEQVEHTKLVQSLEEKQGALRRKISSLASKLYSAETEREVLRDKVKSLKKQKISLQNQMATAWRQVQDWKTDEDGNQRTLTGAIDAGLDDKDKQIAQLKKEVDLLTSKTRSRGGITSFRK